MWRPWAVRAVRAGNRNYICIVNQQAKVVDPICWPKPLRSKHLAIAHKGCFAILYISFYIALSDVFLGMLLTAARLLYK